MSELQGRDVIQYKLYLSGYHKFCNHHWRPEDIRRTTFDRFKGNNTGVLFWGERGCGKSQILSYVSAWAHENEWVNLSVTDPEKFISGKTDLLRYKNGLYLQQNLAKQFLEDFRTSNEQILREFEVDMAHYGKFDISGVRDGDPEPCPRVWDEKRQVYTDQWRDMLYDIEVKHMEAKYETMNYRISDKLADPKTLFDIANEGVNNPESATNALAEILEQLYKSDKHKTMICLDNFNQWLQPTRFPSFRYANDKHLDGHIPPHDMALCRLLMQFDGHYMRNGVKVFATSHKRQFNHIATPEQLQWFTGYEQRVENLTLNDFRSAMRYWTFTEWMGETYDKEWELENRYMETQGNWYAFHAQMTRSIRAYY